jgi:hypothetical protein
MGAVRAPSTWEPARLRVRHPCDNRELTADAGGPTPGLLGLPSHDRFRARVLLGAFTGLRYGELTFWHRLSKISQWRGPGMTGIA